MSSREVKEYIYCRPAKTNMADEKIYRRKQKRLFLFIIIFTLLFYEKKKEVVYGICVFNIVVVLHRYCLDFQARMSCALANLKSDHHNFFSYAYLGQRPQKITKQENIFQISKNVFALLVFYIGRKLIRYSTKQIAYRTFALQH